MAPPDDPEGYWYKGWSPFFDPKPGRPGYGLKGRGAHQGYQEARRAAIRARRAENQFAVQLRRIARMIGHIVTGMATPDEPSGLQRIVAALQDYGRLITPWANATAERLLADVSRRDAAGWHQLGQSINRALREEIAGADIGPHVQRLIAETTDFITSLPYDAAERVQRLAMEAVTGGKRWEDIAQELYASGEVSLSRANLIARTETSRAATTLQQVRAEHVGSEGYIWRTARDRDVRVSHKDLEGSFHKWSEPPVATDPGQREVRAHPGQIYNCRCFPEIVLPGMDISARLGPQARNPAYLEALRAAGYTEGAAFE
jgi:SPP1 gp7 family putative phage head morphogenesis protein